MAEEKRAARIAALNDRLRTQFDLSLGHIMFTDGVNELEPARKARVLQAVRTFVSFADDNDPYGEHDCAVMAVDGIKIIWKIDYYDLTRRYHSPDASDRNVTSRVMTIMRADEY